MKKHDMHDDVTRRKVFWLLQRLTSWTLWKTKHKNFKIFAVAYENAVKTWPLSHPKAIDPDHLEAIYEILSDYDEGITELASGRRFVWRAGGALERAVRKFDNLGRYFYRDPDYWERGQTATYPPKVDALYQLMRASQFQMDYAPLEVQSDENVAHLEWPGALLDLTQYDHGFYELGYPVFPAALPDIPDPAGLVIRSGQSVPCDGIWEPVAIEPSRISGTIPVDAKRFRNNGCFNYFVADVIAPGFADVDVDTFDVTLRSTYWRLLWEDTRYTNGVVPDESQYILKAGEGPRRLMSILR
ncbi:Imm72 family immunity protein [Burkholderia multivorans]|uniref:Imm72 family immunity protein n=1 Tax=Burkholderia multivorans TaxID=87883 RepID=UPI000CFE452A|nr:Imm72 family immunity protein [Burkholderia multivorans]MBU9299256.1 hypothetical protein [Burkholderia multivorans]MBU9305677.1 hypothetical protein [Burkholderia multivorans]MBU9409152.1 hypothetical protein [Burkholderia multivorans]MBU9502516.1 hypothetical protein [Burkholderia multivorans]MBU9509903.1 hypothetical protein [Burkholderia multivorans]